MVHWNKEASGFPCLRICRILLSHLQTLQSCNKARGTGQAFQMGSAEVGPHILAIVPRNNFGYPHDNGRRNVDRYSRVLKTFILEELGTHNYTTLYELMNDAERVEAAKGRKYQARLGSKGAPRGEQIECPSEWTSVSSLSEN
jgi:hypothetical protein